MASAAEPGAHIEGFSMRPARLACVASLRYFDAAGDFGEGLAGVLGGALPAQLCAVGHGASATTAEIVLAWRSPTETWALCGAAQLAALEAFAARRADLCVVDQTGGLRAWTLTGSRVADVLVRLGSPSLVPGPGDARIGRLAELTVLAAAVGSGETLLLVDRAYEEHLLTWVRQTLADLPDR